MSEVWSGVYCAGQKPADSFVLRMSTENEPTVQLENSTGIKTSIGGQEQRRIYWPQDRAHFPFTTMPFTPAQNQVWRDFVVACRGQGNNFYFFWFEPETYVLQDVGLYVSGSLIDLPYQNVASVTAVKNLTTSTNLTFGAVTAPGTGGEGRIASLSPTPTAGDHIGVTFVGNKRYLVRIEQAKPARRFFNKGVTNVPRPMWDMQFVEVI